MDQNLINSYLTLIQKYDGVKPEKRQKSPLKKIVKNPKDIITIQKFEDLPVSTRTIIVVTNININLSKLEELCTKNITSYTIIPKRRGRKKKEVLQSQNEHLIDTNIITVEYGSKTSGTRLKKKKSTKKGHDYFRNSLTIVMYMQNKFVNLKVCQNGKIQSTGIKSYEQCEKCVEALWKLVKNNKEIYTYKTEEYQQLTAMYIPALRNIDFSLGIRVDREKLDNFFNSSTSYLSMYETSIGYSGVNIKIPFMKPITDLQIKKMFWNNKKNTWGKSILVPYEEYLELLSEKEREKKITAKRYHTLLCFQSGKIIFSSICEDFAKDVYYEIMEIFKNNIEQIKEVLYEGEKLQTSKKV